MCASSRFAHFVGLRIKGRSVDESGGELGSPNAVVAGVLPIGYLPPPGKGKRKIIQIRYPCGSEYLRVAMRYTDAMGPSRVEPSYAKTFATHYRPPPGVRIWCPDVLTSYVVPVSKMVCLFHQKRLTKFQCVPVPTLSQFLEHLGQPSGCFQG